MADITADITKTAKDVVDVAKDMAYVVIGAGVLGVQKVQVHRQEVQTKLQNPTIDLSGRLGAARDEITGRVAGLDGKVDLLIDRVEGLIEQVEAVMAPFEERLPTQARDLAKQAHVQAKDARTQLRNIRPTVVA